MIEVLREKIQVKIPRYQGLLEDAGISTFIRNDSVASFEVSIPDFYPALCIVNESDLEKAVSIIKEEQLREQATDHQLANKEVPCPKCKESCPADFAECWNCSSPLPY